MSVMEGAPYKCDKCGRIFEPDRYLDFLNHKRSHK